MKRIVLSICFGLAFCVSAGQKAVFPAEKMTPFVFSDNPGNVFFSENPVELHRTPDAPELDCTLQDWHGKVLHSGIRLDRKNDPLFFSGLPCGFYTLTVFAKNTLEGRFNFIIIPVPETRKYSRDEFFALDTAMSWLAEPGDFNCRWYQGDSFRVVRDLVHWAGFSQVRDRLLWRDVHPSAGKTDYGKYLNNARLFRQRNIRISGMFHDAPAYLDTRQSIPRDLAGLYRGCRQLAKDFGSCMSNWEFWNEQDIGFSKAPVWDYMAGMKAASLGFRAGNPDAIIAPGAVCSGVNSPFHRAMYLNDCADYTDVLNYHTYAPPAEYALLGYKLRRFRIKHNIPDRAVWITECGTHMEGHAALSAAAASVGIPQGTVPQHHSRKCGDPLSPVRLQPGRNEINLFSQEYSTSFKQVNRKDK